MITSSGDLGSTSCGSSTLLKLFEVLTSEPWPRLPNYECPIVLNSVLLVNELWTSTINMKSLEVVDLQAQHLIAKSSAFLEDVSISSVDASELGDYFNSSSFFLDSSG